MTSVDLSKYDESLDEDYDYDLEDEEDEAYLGEATLAKLRGGEVSFDDEGAADAERGTRKK
jgi:hypothetical protein